MTLKEFLKVCFCKNISIHVFSSEGFIESFEIKRCVFNKGDSSCDKYADYLVIYFDISQMRSLSKCHLSVEIESPELD